MYAVGSGGSSSSTPATSLSRNIRTPLNRPYHIPLKMAMRSRDLTLDLDQKRVTIQTWSSDPNTYTVSNKFIRTTLDNTVQDLKEVISERSYDSGGNINPLALKLSYRFGELRNSDPLSMVFENELELDQLDLTEPIRIRVEFDKTKLMRKTVKPCLLNVNLRTSNGKVVRLSETMHTTVESLKYTLVDDLHLANGMSEITSLEFNGGVDAGLDNTATISDLLELDTVPFGDLNFFVALASDVRIKLSSPNENILRTSFMSVNLDTTIFTVKKYILDQYSGLNPNVTTDDIRVIYFGRVLTDDIRIRNISSPSTSSATLVLHFVLQEPEDHGPSSGFWSDLKNGRLFEFYPKEPNPYFATESQRIERLREQFRNNGTADEPTTRDRSQGIFVRDYVPPPANTPLANSLPENTPPAEPIAVPQQPTLPDATNTRQIPLTVLDAGQYAPQETPHGLQTNSDNDPRPNLPCSERVMLEGFMRTHRLPENSTLTGKSYDVVQKDGEEYLIDQEENGDIVYRVTLQTSEGPRVVTLSSNQAIINDTIPGMPYFMVTKAGYAKLEKLGIDIELPEVQISRQHHPAPAAPDQPHVNHGPVQPVAVREQAPAPVVLPELANFNNNPDGNRAVAQQDIIGRVIERLMEECILSVRYIVVYLLLIRPYFTGYQHHLAVAALIFYAYSTQLFIPAVNIALQRVGFNPREVFNLNFEGAHNGARGLMKAILAFGVHPGHDVNQFERALRSIIVDGVLLLSSLSPSLHEMFMLALRELEEEHNRPQEVPDEVHLEVEAEDEVAPENIPENGDVATGANRHNHIDDTDL